MTTPATRFCPTDLGDLAYTDTGPSDDPSAPAIIFMHGLPTSKAIFDPMRPHLDPRLRVITFDLHDYGESAKLKAPIRHPDRARTLDQLRAHLGLDQFVLAAHDLGASVAIDYMGDFGDRVSKFVIMSPPIYPDFVEPAVVHLVRRRGLGEFLLWLMSDFMVDRSIRKGMHHTARYTPEIAAGLHRAFAGPEGRAALMRNLRWGTPKDMYARYPEIIRGISVPTLILQGARDPYIPRSQVDQMHDAVDDARLVFIDDGAHFIPMDTPAEASREINGFLFG